MNVLHLINKEAAVQIGQKLGEWFDISIGSRQGDPISPITFLAYLERIIDEIRNRETGVSIHGRLVNNLKFADDLDLLEENPEFLQQNTNMLGVAANSAGLK